MCSTHHWYLRKRKVSKRRDKRWQILQFYTEIPVFGVDDYNQYDEQFLLTFERWLLCLLSQNYNYEKFRGQFGTLFEHMFVQVSLKLHEFTPT